MVFKNRERGFAAMENLARQFLLRGMPAYFDLNIAIKALGCAAYYADKPGIYLFNPPGPAAE